MISRATGLLAAAAALAAAPTGCTPMYSLAAMTTVKASDLPSDVATLDARSDEYLYRSDEVSLANALAVLEKERSVVAKGETYGPLWRESRVYFALADQADSDLKRSKRAWYAKQGVQLAHDAIAANPKGVEGHYYLALNLGYVAATYSFYQKSVRFQSARDLVEEMAKEAKAAADLDERYDHAGARRLLGVVYLRAPGWPASIGDPEEGLMQLKRTIEIDPAFPHNRLYYAEALLANDRLDDAEKEIAGVRAAPPTTDPLWLHETGRLHKMAADLEKRIAQKRNGG